MSVQIFDLPSGCNCDNKSEYTEADILAAATRALELASQGQTIGRDKYPHAYNDYEKFKFDNAQKPYIEFPILSSEQVYDGESPGADRVILGSIADDYESAIYCAVITHDGSTKNGFTECADDTVNQDGKGAYTPRKRHHHTGKHPEGRNLLERPDF
ncbi:Ribonuclease/ribotoxin [Mycena galericulata]|nr:Ribonuclease/ribotoxin [Mycena galericulata]